ncbi:MAG: peptidoglycan DD-metalloendopeptidase family protein [Thermoleophilia bacterium]|nr:peptidoglycan DD-metalloendopeptidase family protein [Thermoleophilia bacterium]
MSTGRTKSLSLAACAIFLICAGPAFAITSGGGLAVPKAAEIDDVVCLSGCTEIRTSSPGGKIQVSGSDLGTVSYVSFAGKNKRTKAKPYFTAEDRVEAVVPEDARTGRVRMISSSGYASDFSEEKLDIGEAMELGRTSPIRLTDAETSPSRAYQYGKKRPTLNYVINGGKEINDLRIDITSSSGQVVDSKFKENVPTGTGQSVGWNGRTSAGKSAPNGAYRFVVRSTDGTEAIVSKSLTKASRSKKEADPFAFKIYGYVFPIRGPHTYGDGLGAGRGHQGQDVLADCGTKLIAARAGTVYTNDYQASGAGNYLVINIKGAGGKSHVYMHMLEPSPLKEGTHVKTGQRIGKVGTTGHSTACHTHFEVWSGPGWYQGGTFIDPTTPLKRWDKYS